MMYSDLSNWLNAVLGDDHSTDTDWPVYLPAIIQRGELRCYRDVDFLATRKVATIVLAANVSSFTAPTDWMLGMAIRLTDINVTLDRREISFVKDYGGVGQPRYWSEPTQGTIWIAPTPTLVYNAELAYHYRPAPISSTNPSTWLATNCPDLLFSACMVEAAGYMRNYGAQSDDPKMALSWSTRYSETLEIVRREEARRKGEPAFDASFAPPPTSNLPQ